MRISNIFDNAPYFRWTVESDNGSSIGYLCDTIIVVHIVVKTKWLKFRILPGGDYIYSRYLLMEFPFSLHFIILGGS